jgi:hypothetical protein
MTERAQTFTLEAFVAAILLLSTVAFALQVVSISSNTASTGDLETRNHHVGLASGVLDQGAANGSLRTTLLFWDESTEQFYGADETDGYYISRSPPTAFGASLARMFDDRQVRYNVDLYFATTTGDRGHQRLVESGTPTDDGVRVVETVTLYDRTRLVDTNETARATTLGDVEADANSTFYAPDVRPDGPVYNVVRVEVVLWET